MPRCILTNISQVIPYPKKTIICPKVNSMEKHQSNRRTSTDNTYTPPSDVIRQLESTEISRYTRFY